MRKRHLTRCLSQRRGKAVLIQQVESIINDGHCVISGNKFRAFIDVAEVERQPVGYIWVMHTSKNRSEIYSIAIEPAFRRQGIARFLITSVIGKLGRTCEILLQTRSDSTGIVALIDDLGFELGSLRFMLSRVVIN